MPITQERMLELVAAATECFDAFRALTKYITYTGERNLAGERSDREALEDIISYASRLQVSPEAMRNLGKEQERFTRARQADNVRRRIWQQHRRNAQRAGLTPSRDTHAMPQDAFPTQRPRTAFDHLPSGAPPRLGADNWTPEERATIAELSRPQVRRTPPPIPRHHFGPSAEDPDLIEQHVEPAKNNIEPEAFTPEALVEAGSGSEYPDDVAGDDMPGDPHI